MAPIVREPSPAELARTALAAPAPRPSSPPAARHRARSRSCRSRTGDGRPLVRLERSSPTVRLLASCPVVTLSLPGPAPYRAVDLIGPLNPCRAGRDGARSYRLSLLSARLVAPSGQSVPIPLGEFQAAEPDPLRSCAAAALQHLETWHADDLLACVRAHGGDDVLAVVPRALDRYGIELASLGPDGVRRVRLRLPRRPGRQPRPGDDRPAHPAHLPLPRLSPPQVGGSRSARRSCSDPSGSPAPKRWFVELTAPYITWAWPAAPAGSAPLPRRPRPDHPDRRPCRGDAEGCMLLPEERGTAMPIGGRAPLPETNRRLGAPPGRR